MILTANHRDALHASVFGILRGCAHTLERYALFNKSTSAPNDVSSPDDVADSIAAICAVVHAACTDFKHSWNYRPGALPILKLPNELLVAIFHMLDFTQRIGASHVCRRWRAAAVSARTLWTDISLDFRGEEKHVSSLALCLIDRSHPAPFRLTVWTRGHPYQLLSVEVYTVIRHNIWRLESYSGLDSVAFELGLHLSSSLPSLTFIDFGFSGGTLDIPYLWCGEGAPRLSSMNILGFTFPRTSTPFTALRHFSGRLSHDRREAACLFEYCPQLQTLRLWDVHETSVLPSGPFPQSIEQITLELSSRSARPHDPSRLLATWQGYHLRRLKLDAVDNIEPVVGLFTRAHHDGWNLFIDKRTLVLSAEDDFRYTICLNRYKPNDSFPGLAAHAGRLERLTITGPSILKLYHSRLHLPALQSLQILFRGDSLQSDWRQITTTPGTIVAPLLRTMDFAWSPCRADLDAAVLRFACLTLPWTLRRHLVSYDAKVLQRITLTLTGQPEVEPGAIALAALAKEFVIIRRYDLGGGAFDDVTTFPADPITLLAAV